MSDGTQSDQTVPNKSQVADPGVETLPPSSSRGESKPPLTPESPPFKTKKRTAGLVEEEDKEIDSAVTSPSHPVGHPCVCQPEPKIPRPRNAFILYRQHYQASIVAQHPGLANPEISKIIGEQWQNQPLEVKNEWKAYAEEEKARHQQQYPTYRYQPRRNGRRNSLTGDSPTSAFEKPKCTKCGGRTNLALSAPLTGTRSHTTSPSSIPPTPGSAATPVTRTLPVLRDLGLQSPAQRRLGKQFHGGNMHVDDHDDIGPLSPDMKRRRYNSEHPPSITRVMPPRYVVAPGAPVGPGTPFPFGQQPQQAPHPYPPGAVMVQDRRESLPGLRGMVVHPQGPPMGPPARPSIGYHQHRMSQGRVVPDHSLTLPPLQTVGVGSVGSTPVTANSAMTAQEQIVGMDFRYRLSVLRQVAPPIPITKAAPRGPLVAIEGDNPETVAELGVWLRDHLVKEDSDLSVKLVEGPTVSAEGSKEVVMASYHTLVAQWLLKSVGITDSLKMKAPASGEADSVMKDAAQTSAPTPAAKPLNRELDENYSDSETANPDPRRAAEKMDVDASTPSTKPISIVANYALHASTFYACHIPLAATDPYSPQDHWNWAATQWRSVVSPDLVIYLRNADAGGKPTVDIQEDKSLFVVKRTAGEGVLEGDRSLLRRLGFEVSEWARAFGGKGE